MLSQSHMTRIRDVKREIFIGGNLNVEMQRKK